MRVGVPTEIKTLESRVGLTPGSVRELVVHGHEVLVQRGAGANIGFPDEAYAAAGAGLAADAAEVFAKSDMIVKVKEPQPAEIARLRAGADAVHLSAPGAGSGSRPRADGVGRDVHRV